MGGGKKAGAAEDLVCVILRHDVHGIRTVKLIRFHGLLRAKRPAELLDKHPVAITGYFRIQILWKML
ncbi:hypothetical protein TPL01_13410 [Sulfuriferula plumbiphila]|uniref:Uncharacterized protein n=1 Tax=Sulfuriferula plumbiphila TaxID=171865 RepID=A0A512L6U0_9PROT|nr:hypothetical protein SFPGR_03520 [Sulfuriferula plumbiphila]GEP30203.1 hypothetical protein TPL01_13410 [Sulfuriferula plumbiphila]